MKSYEFSRYWHPRLGRFVFRHKGNGIIVDNIFKPMRKVASAVFSKFAKPLAKKALQSGISHAGDKLGKKSSGKIWRFDHEKTGKYENWQKTTSSPESTATRSASSTPRRKF